MTVEAIRRERLGLVDWLRQLSPSDWNRPSLCAGWTVKHVVAPGDALRGERPGLRAQHCPPPWGRPGHVRSGTTHRRQLQSRRARFGAGGQRRFGVAPTADAHGRAPHRRGVPQRGHPMGAR
ncbi:MAG: maleylpyruvate isomerase N-terminal domain-containing protein [Nocardioidaceae bacterium]|nr:maleylpyruvate isomerase N-terminal domain-containing protein [Nocardioidaceae bacterium]